MPKRALALAAVLLLIIVAIVWPTRPIEPSHQGKTITLWLNELASNILNEPNIDPPKTPAIRAVLEMGPDAIPYLRQALREGNLPSQKAIDRLRLTLPQKLRAKIPSPSSANSWALKTAAAHCLTAFGAHAHEAIPELIACVESISSGGPHSTLAGNIATYAIFQIGFRPEHLPHLQRWIESTNSLHKSSAIFGLTKLGIKDPKTIDTLIKSISLNPTGIFDKTASATAIRTLGELRVNDPPLQTVLKNALTNSHLIIRLNAALALRKILGPTETSDQILLQILSDQKNSKVQSQRFLIMESSDHVALSIAQALDEEKSPRKPLLDALRLQPLVAVQAKLVVAHALWKHSGDTNRLENIWNDGIRHGDHNVVRQTALQMHEICAAQRIAPPELNLMISSHVPVLRVLAAATLWKVNGETERTVPILIEGLGDHFTYSKIRAAASIALGEMGPKAIAAKPPLTKLLHDPDPKVRAAARSALRKLSPN